MHNQPYWLFSGVWVNHYTVNEVWRNSIRITAGDSLEGTGAAEQDNLIAIRGRIAEQIIEIGEGRSCARRCEEALLADDREATVLKVKQSVERARVSCRESWHSGL